MACVHPVTKSCRNLVKPLGRPSVTRHTSASRAYTRRRKDGHTLMLRFSGGRLLGLRSGLAIAITAAALSMAPSAAQAAFTLQPCHGSATAGRGATFPALLHNGGFWGSGFDSAAGCSGAPAHPSVQLGDDRRDGQRRARLDERQRRRRRGLRRRCRRLALRPPRHDGPFLRDRRSRSPRTQLTTMDAGLRQLHAGRSVHAGSDAPAPVGERGSHGLDSPPRGVRASGSGDDRRGQLADHRVDRQRRHHPRPDRRHHRHEHDPALHQRRGAGEGARR